MPSKYSSDWPATEHVNPYLHCILSFLPVSPSLSPCEHKILVSISLSLPPPPSPSLWVLTACQHGGLAQQVGPSGGCLRQRVAMTPRYVGLGRGPPMVASQRRAPLRMHELSPLNGVQQPCMERPICPSTRERTANNMGVGMTAREWCMCELGVWHGDV